MIDFIAISTYEGDNVFDVTGKLEFLRLTCLLFPEFS